MICTSNRSMCRWLSVFSHSTSLMNYVDQPLDHAQGLRLSASKKGKSSSILLFERRREEKEDFACSERDVVPDSYRTSRNRSYALISPVFVPLLKDYAVVLPPQMKLPPMTLGLRPSTRICLWNASQASSCFRDQTRRVYTIWYRGREPEN